MNGVIFQCAACRALAVADSIRVDGDRAGLACTACGAITMLPVAHRGGARVVVDAESPRPAPPPKELPAPSSLAPAGQVAVRDGGLDGAARERVAARVARLPPVAEQQETLAAGFDKLLARWDDAAEHKRLLKSAAIAGELAFMGQRYRAVLEEVPGDAAAKTAQNEIMTLAMASLTARKDLGAPEKSAGQRTQWIAAAVLAVVFAAVTLWLLPKLLPPDQDGATIERTHR